MSDPGPSGAPDEVATLDEGLVTTVTAGDPRTLETGEEPRAPPAPRARHPFFRVTLAVGALLLVAGVVVGLQVMRLGDFARDLGWDASYADGWRILSVDAAGPVAGLLQVGDRIVAIDGDRRLGPSLWLHFDPRRSSPAYRLTIAREATERDVVARPVVRSSPGLVRKRVFPYFMLSVGWCLAGLLAGLGRPDLPSARRVATAGLASAAFGLNWAAGPLVDLMPPFPYVVTMAVGLLTPFEYALGFDFLATFPSGVRPRRAVRLAVIFFYASAAALCLGGGLLMVTHLVAPGAAIGLDARLPWMALVAGDLWGPFLFAVSTAGLSVVVYNYLQLADPGQRRRVRWLILGTVAGFLPIVGEGLLLSAARAGASGPALDRIWYRLALVEPWFIFLIPATFAYTVLAHRLLDIRVVVRRGLRYLLAKSALTVALTLPLALLAVDLALSPDRTLLQVAHQRPWLLGLSVLALVGLAGRTRALALLDRLFFREARNRERILHALVEKVGGCISLAELARLSAAELDAALHPTTVAVLWRDRAGEGLRLVHPVEAAIPPRALRGSALLRRLEEAPSSSWDAERVPLPPEDRRWAGALGATLFVPVADSGRRLSGVIALGPKRSEEPYTADDRRLLQTVAVQVGLVCENLALKSLVDDGDRTRREVLAHLTEEARPLPIVECPVCGLVDEPPAEQCRADGSRLSLRTPVERTLDGKYRLERVLGRGGMGTVYEARDLRLQRQVAVKVLTGPAFDRPNAVRRFEREARVCAHLHHPNIVTVHDYGRTRAADGAYLVMERLAGTSLRDELRSRGGPVAPLEVATWVEPILDAMQAAHAEGIVHRDLKPENIFLSRDPGGRQVVKVLDFGLAKILGNDSDGEPKLTVPGSTMGTLAYMAPEQFLGEAADPRADLYALGLITAECVLGRHPFGARDPQALAGAILGAAFRLPGDAPEVRSLDRVIGWCVAKTRDERPASVEELRKRLIPALRACPPL